MQKYGDWELIEPPLGEGGQSVVYLARTPARGAERAKCLEQIRLALDGDKRPELATAIWSYARPDHSSELGALKIFKIREGGAPAKERLRREISILRENRPHLPRLLDSNEDEQWMVTEYFPGKTLAESPFRYKGEPALALRAFRTLVETVAISLHKDKIVHRDIKPANVFVGADGSLIPGDFGIVYLPDGAARPTVTQERVGPRDYMPQWADLGVRLEDVQPNLDVYMLGKLLWCMISGRLRLPREYQRWPEFDLAAIFPNNNYMHLINSILDMCLVERPEQCLRSAEELLKVVDETLTYIDDGVPFVDQSGRLILPCRICGKGFYQAEANKGIIRLTRFDEGSRQVGENRIRAFLCNVCAHYAFFAPGYPDEAAARNWKAWSPPFEREV
jgi:serine/threonine protein kinase